MIITCKIIYVILIFQYLILFLGKKYLKKYKLYIIIECVMAETEINNYINKKCYNCCHFKKENMELYKLNLPNGIVNNIIDYSLGKENICRTCKNGDITKTQSNIILILKGLMKEMLKMTF